MAHDPTNTKFHQFRDVLHKITQEVERMAIEIDAFEKLAISKGATSLEIHQAMESHRADPEIRKAIKERYKLLWDVLFDAGTESFADETLESLQIVRKPN